MDIYFVRHGQTDWNITWKLQGRADIPINARGRQQAAALRTRLAGVTLDAAYVSPLCRAQQTAHILLCGTNVPVYTQPALAERDFGAYEGLRKEDFDFEAFWHPEVPCPRRAPSPQVNFMPVCRAFCVRWGAGRVPYCWWRTAASASRCRCSHAGCKALSPAGSMCLLFCRTAGYCTSLCHSKRAKSIKFTKILCK